MNNAKAIYDFVTHWTNEPNMKISDYGNAQFLAKINYSFDGKCITEEATVSITRNGYDDGKISLEERGKLLSTFLHLDFNPKFQKYVYEDESHALVVFGESPKLHGKFQVSISPI